MTMLARIVFWMLRRNGPPEARRETEDERVRRESGRCPSYHWFPDATGYEERWCAGPLHHAGDHSDNPDLFAVGPDPA